MQEEEACQKKPRKCALSSEATDDEVDVVDITDRNTDTRGGKSVYYLLSFTEN